MHLHYLQVQVSRIVHYLIFQHYEYHQPLKVGDVITAEVKPGKSWEKESKRAGKLKFSESVTEYRNQDGELIITATSVGVVTEKPVEN